MNWQAVGFDWNQVRAFLATAEEGSFSAAARALGTTQPTVGRQVAALEATLGVTLFDRIGKSLSLTDGGRQVLAQVRAMGDAAGRVSLAAAGLSRGIDGEVTVTASDLLAAAVLPPVVRELRAEAPGLALRIVADAEIRNLLRREADIAIRHVRPEQADLIARHVTDAEAGFYAARTYLDRVGPPRTADDLSAHTFVAPAAPDQFAQYLTSRGYPVQARQMGTGCNSGVVMWELVRAGLGVGVMPVALAADDPVVERVLPDAAFRFPIWLASHRDLLTTRRIRIVFDALAGALARRFASR